MREWQQTTLGALTELVTKGTTPSEKDGGFAEFGINYIKSDAINYAGKIDKSKFVYISEKLHEKFKRSQLKKDDILFSMAGAFLGKTGMVSEDMLPANTNQAVAIIRINQLKAEPKYIHFFLRQDSIVDFVNNMSGQSAQPNINFQEIKSIDLRLPHLEEQQAIASVLSSLDDKIDLLHRQNKTLEAMAETLFRQWFVEEAKDDWDKVRLGDVLAIIESGSRPKGGIDPDLKIGVPSIGAENINGLGNYSHAKTKYITNEFFESMKRGIISDYDVLVYKDGAYVGRKAMFGKGYPFDVCSVNEHVFILRANKSTNQFFLYFLLNEEDLSLLNTNSAQPGLNQESMKSFEISLPPKSLADEFGNTVKPMIEKIFANGKQIMSLERLRDFLLPKLISGEVKVVI